jgi:hypothetical protein
MAKRGREMNSDHSATLMTCDGEENCSSTWDDNGKSMKSYFIRGKSTLDFEKKLKVFLELSVIG